ncbi:MAG: hypothetical protein J0626_06900, partial [Rhodospirillaceae bacterium]|nr:hypothetical protein [Rhodospirillaceae bacterium]
PATPPHAHRASDQRDDQRIIPHADQPHQQQRAAGTAQRGVSADPGRR